VTGRETQMSPLATLTPPAVRQHDVWGSEGDAPRILKLDTKWDWPDSHSGRVVLEERAVGTQCIGWTLECLHLQGRGRYKNKNKSVALQL
jgi:hypothetical protein